MTDHRKRVANAIRIAKEVHGKRLLQDQYPTHYMPNVGRQVMAGGGPAEAPSDDSIEIPAVYDEMGNVAVPAQRKVVDEGYRQPLGERIKEGISKGFGERRLGMSEEDQRRYDPTGIVQNVFAAPVDFALRAPGAVVGGLSAAGAGVYGKIPGVDETQTNKLQRDLRVLGDVGMIEAGNVRSKAPTDVSSIPRFGELIPPEASNALRISREVKERPFIDMEGLSRTPEQLQTLPERQVVNSDATQGVSERQNPLGVAVEPLGNLNFRPSITTSELKGPDVQKVEDFINQIKGRPGVNEDVINRIREINAPAGNEVSRLSKEEFIRSFPPSEYKKVDLKGAAGVEGEERHFRILAENEAANREPSDVLLQGMVDNLHFPYNETTRNQAEQLAKVLMMEQDFNQLPPDFLKTLEANGIKNFDDIDTFADSITKLDEERIYREIMESERSLQNDYGFDNIQRLVKEPNNDRYFEIGLVHPEFKGKYPHFPHYVSEKDGLIGHFRGQFLDQNDHLLSSDVNNSGVTAVPNSAVIEEIQSDIQKGVKQTGITKNVHATTFKAAVQHALEGGAQTVYYPTSKMIWTQRGGDPKAFNSIYDKEIIQHGLNPLLKIPGVVASKVGDDYIKIDFTRDAIDHILKGGGQRYPGLKDGGPVNASTDVPSDGTTEVPAVYDEMGNVLVPAQRIVIDEGYRQPLGERIKEGISKGFGEQRLGMREEDQRRYDPTGLVQNMFAAPADLFLRAPGAVIGGLSALGAGAYGALPGVDETQTNKLQRDLKVLGDVGMIEAGNVRPKAPTDVSSIPRFGEVLPPEASNALRISREVKERPIIDMEGSSRAPDTFLNAPEQPRPPISEGFAAPERPSLAQETYREPQLPAERPQAPPETPVAPVEAPGGNINMSRRSFLRGMGATAASTIMPEGVVSALTETVKPTAVAPAVYDASKVSSLMSDMLGQRVPVLNNENISRHVNPQELSRSIEEYPSIYGASETAEGTLNPNISRWEMIKPENSYILAENFASNDPAILGMSKDAVSILKTEMEGKLGYQIPDEDFNKILGEQLKPQISLHDLKHDVHLVSEEGLDHDMIFDGIRARAVAAAHSIEKKPTASKMIEALGQVTPEDILEKVYGIPKDRVQSILDEPIVESYDDTRTTTLRDHFNAIYEESLDWWEDLDLSDKRAIRKAWNDEAKKIKSGLEEKPELTSQTPAPVEDVKPYMLDQNLADQKALEAPAAPAPKTLDDLRLAQAQAKQAFEDAKVAVRSDNKNPETRALVAQRQKEMMAATKELEKAESNREPRSEATPNAAPKVVEPEYVRRVSDFGLYSHAAEVAAKAKQAGKPEDLITWLKAQPGVKMEELESVGAVTPSGKFNPEFAGGVKTMTPKELSDIFNEKTPDPKLMRRTETKVMYPRNTQELADLAIENPRVWDNYFGFTLGTHRDFNKIDLNNILQSEEGQRALSEVFNFTYGKIEVPGGAIYGPSSWEDYTTRGGKNYEEIPIYLEPTPENPPTKFQTVGGFADNQKFNTREEAEKYLEDEKARSLAYYADDPQMQQFVEQGYKNTYIVEFDDPSYRSPNLTEFGHMKDVPNNIAWIRKTEHDSPYGGVAYRMEESQSDLAQRGRDTGFNMNPEEVETAKARIEQIESQIDELDKKWVQYYSDSVEKGTYNTPEYLKDEKKFLKEQDGLSKKQDRIRRHIMNSEQGTSLPNFPYVKETQQWTDLTVKLALIDAANGGFDSVQFIKGDTNRERYQEEGKDTGYHYDVNIPSSISRILKTLDPSVKLETIKVEPTIDSRTFSLINRIKDRNADIEERMRTHRAYLNRLDPSSREYGVAESIMSDYEQGLYDGNAALKKLTTPLELWSVRMTPKLQRAIQKGLPKFKDGGAVNPGAIRGMTVDELQEALMG